MKICNQLKWKLEKIAGFLVQRWVIRSHSQERHSYFAARTNVGSIRERTKNESKLGTCESWKHFDSKLSNFEIDRSKKFKLQNKHTSELIFQYFSEKFLFFSRMRIKTGMKRKFIKTSVTNFDATKFYPSNCSKRWRRTTNSWSKRNSKLTENNDQRPTRIFAFLHSSIIFVKTCNVPSFSFQMLFKRSKPFRKVQHWHSLREKLFGFRLVVKWKGKGASLSFSISWSIQSIWREKSSDFRTYFVVKSVLILFIRATFISQTIFL